MGRRARASSRATARSLFVLGERFGNVFVGIQPSMGYEGDPMRLLFEKGFAPTHAFSAFYRWMREDFGADAVLHFGTHGALEFMPGKQSGLTGMDWPDRLIGDLPNLYLYAANNPSEGAIAKRRAAATLISYLTPPVAHAGLYRGLVDLKALDRAVAHAASGGRHAARRDRAVMIQAQAAAVDLAAMEPAWDAEAAAGFIGTLTNDILELEYTLIPHGLHEVGATPTLDERAEQLMAVAEASHDMRPPRAARSTRWCAARRSRPRSAAGGLAADDKTMDAFAALRAIDVMLAQDHELPAIIRALDGRFVRPAPGGDLLRTPAILPTGRNLHGFDPFKLPSPYACQDGARQAERLLERHMRDGNALPESIAIVLWGTDNLKTEGAPIAQVLALLGTRPRFDSFGRLAGASLIPLEELGRPRIDVIVTMSGIFRDLLPLQIRLLAEAAFMARQRRRAGRAELHPQARARLPGRAQVRFRDGRSGASSAMPTAPTAPTSNNLLESGRWEDEDELAETYSRRKGLRLWPRRRADEAGERCCRACCRPSSWPTQNPRFRRARRHLRR